MKPYSSRLPSTFLPTYRICLGIACLTLLTRLPFLLLVAQDPQRALEPDSGTYTKLAEGILDFHSFRTEPDSAPEIHRTPGYPAFLAGVYLISQSPLAVSVTQVLISALTAILVVWIAYHVAQSIASQKPTASVAGISRRAGLLAGILFAFDPVSAGYTCLVLTEHLFGVLLTCTTAIFIFGISNQSQRTDTPTCASRSLLISVSLSGFLTALNTLIRPIGLLLGFAQLPYLWCKMRYRRAFIRTAALLLICSLLFPALWILRNGLATGAYTLSDIGSVNLYFYRAAAVIAEIENRPFHIVQEELRKNTQHQVQQRDLSRSEVLDYMNQNAAQILISHPFLTVKHAAIGVSRMLLGPGRSLFQQILGVSASDYVFPFLGWSLFHLIVVYLLTLRYLLTNKQEERWLFIGTIVYFCLLSAGPEAYSRFRVPLMPLFCIMAGLGGTGLLYSDTIQRSHRGNSI